MKLTVNRIVKHHNRGLFSAQPDMMMKTEIDLNRIKSAEIDIVSARKARVIVTDVFQTKYIIGNFAQSKLAATRLADAINNQSNIAIRHHTPMFSVVPNMHIRQMLREQNEAKRKREIELANAIDDVVATITPEEEAAIAAA